METPATTSILGQYNATSNMTPTADPYLVDVWAEHPVLNSVILFFLVIFMTFGTFGNILVIGAVFVYRPLRSPANVFVVNLALADVGISSMVDPAAIVGIVDGYRIYGRENPVFCTVVATLCLWYCIASLYTIMAISINRYIALCYPHKYKQIFTFKSCVGFSVLIWLASIGVEIPNHMGWGSNWYDVKAMICLYDRTRHYSYTVFFAVTAIITPILVVLFCYVKIFALLRKSKKALRLREQTAQGQVNEKKEQKRQEQEMRLAKTLFIIFFVFLVCWGPYAALITVDYFDLMPKMGHAIFIQMAHGNSGGVNSAVYAVSNHKFREGMREFLYYMCSCGKRNVVANASNTGTATFNGGVSIVPANGGQRSTFPVGGGKARGRRHASSLSSNAIRSATVRCPCPRHRNEPRRRVCRREPASCVCDVSASKHATSTVVCRREPASCVCDVSASKHATSTVYMV